MQDTAVFICSSDSRRDVLDRVLPSVLGNWKDCPYPIYVGLNSPPDRWPNITPVLAPPSDWRGELACQLRQLREQRLILLLDDYLIEAPVNQPRMAELLGTFDESRLSYLRLLPLGLSVWERIGGLAKPATEHVRAISQSRPYFCSLQIALWRREHLLAMLCGSGSIWEFEHQCMDGASHFAIAARPPVRYRHLVEKGRWQPYARRLLRKAGLPDDLGSRPVWPEWAYGRVWLDELRFFLHGIANH